MKKSFLLWSVFLVSVLILSACGGGGGGDSAPPPVTPTTTTYTMTYDGNGNTGGSVPMDTVNYAQDQVVTVPGNTGSLVRTHFTFAGWNTASDGSGTNYAQGQTFKMGSSNVKLYAKWTANSTYTVTYNGNGATSGSVPPDTTNYETGDTVTVHGNTGSLAKTGSTFVGWNTAANGSGTTYTQGNTFLMGSADITLYAIWTTNPTYTVTYNGNGNTGGTAPVDTNNYEQGFFVTVLGNTGNLVKTGSTFSGWNTAADGSGTDRAPGSTFTMGTSNVILYAKWTTNPTYTVTYNGNNNTGGTPPVDANNYEQGATVTVLGNTGNLVKTGSTFSGWNTAADGSGTTYTQGQTFAMGSTNVILYAKWTTANPTYTVTYNGNGNTGGSVPTDSTNYQTGNTVTVLGNTGNLVKSGSVFVGWNTGEDGSGITYRPGNTFAMGSANVILYAKWTTNPTYTVTYNGNGATGGSVPTDGTSYETGATVTVLGNTGLLVKTGSTFIGWNPAADGSGILYNQGQTFSMGSANVTLYAIWVAPINTFTFTAGGVSFKMVEVPGKTFRTGTGDGGTATVASAYLIGETEVTYDLWNTVHQWATLNGYNFQNAGTVGSSGAGSFQQPVTTVNWRDAMVWTNAATEWYNTKIGTTYTPVYTYGGLTIKDSRDANATACDGAVAGAAANGFRLLTSNEWELAARYKYDANSDGDISDPGEYYPGNYASGATAPYTDAAATGLVAWYYGNSGGTTHEVKTRIANALGLYDMSGNVWEWCFDLNAPNPTRIYRGGSWTSGESFVELGYVEPMPPATPENKTGFRLGRTQ